MPSPAAQPQSILADLIAAVMVCVGVAGVVGAIVLSHREDAASRRPVVIDGDDDDDDEAGESGASGAMADPGEGGRR